MKHFTGHGLFTIAALLVILFACLLSGCSAVMPLPESTYETKVTHRTELAWQALNALDTAQTVTIARSPDCLYEDNKMAAAIYGGEHPSTSRVLATNVLLAWGHYELGGWLDRRTQAAVDADSPLRGLWYTSKVAFYAVSFLGTGYAVSNNLSLGIRPFSTKECN